MIFTTIRLALGDCRRITCHPRPSAASRREVKGTQAGNTVTVSDSWVPFPRLALCSRLAGNDIE